MTRNKHGFLRRETVMSGMREQVARTVRGAVHTIELGHDRDAGGFWVKHTIVHPNGREVHTWQVGDDLPLARRTFRERTNKSIDSWRMPEPTFTDTTQH